MVVRFNVRGEAAAGEDLIIHVCGIIETGSPDLLAQYAKAAPAIEMGLADANALVLPLGIQLVFHYKDAGPRCGPRNDAFQRIMELMTENVTCHVYIGPGCDDSTADVNTMAEQQDVPLLACPASNIQDVTGKSRDDFTHLIRSPFFYTEICDLILHFLHVTCNYSDIAVVVDPSNVFFNGLGNRMRSFLRGRLKSYAKEVPPNFYFLRSDTKDGSQDEKIRQTLTDINSTARAIILMLPGSFIRNVLVYVGIELYQSVTWGDFEWELHDENDRLAKEGFKSLLLFSLLEASDSASSAFKNDVRQLSRTKFDHLYRYAAFENVDPVTSAYYEAVVFYASAVKALMENETDFRNTTLLLGAMKNVTYPNPRGGKITMDDKGDRVSTYVIKDFDVDTETFVVKITLTGDNISIEAPIAWPCLNGDYNCPLPPNTPACGFDGSLCLFNESISPGVLAAIIICLLIFVGALAVYGVYRHSLREKDPYWWRIPEDKISFPNKGKSMASLRKSHRSLQDDTSSEGQKSVNSGAGLTGTYNQNTISLVVLPEGEFRVTARLVSELRTIHSMRHQNLQKIVGVVVGVQNVCIYKAGEWCSRGSLDDVLENDGIKLDWAFKYSLIKDIAEGISYIHSSVIVSHGFLSAMTCLVDSRFVIKISDFGITELHNPSLCEPPQTKTFSQDFRLFLWRAPEHLRHLMPAKGTQAGDVYSFAILLQQIILRNEPFEPELDPEDEGEKYFNVDIREVVMLVKNGSTPLKRPVVSVTACTPELRSLMIKCWAEAPTDRPAFTKLKETIRKIAGAVGENIIDHLIEQMEQYAADLEKKVAAQTQQFMKEKEKTEELLCQLLPRSIAAALTKGETVDPEQYDMVSIYYSDIVGFTTISAQGTAMDVVALLNSLYSLFDSIIENYDAYKVETIGDAYMIASGLPTRNGDQHGIAIAQTALAIVRGPCVAGVVGMHMPRYCLFGDTVTVAQRLEWSGEPMKIQISTETKTLLQRTGNFVIRERGMTYLKEQGTMMTHWLDSGE
ncbi:Atrial natriuretic peptide receptor 1 [Hypsibius exemplaris]|uniref:Guanylate cyclase n=1 Tax=Hypsibius exemplaris TaxID=2072580 RepID=A0A1W0WYI8_HYPEX|nr:Atrial natriuretic peptide receptor 1 [Hypsibius exemplaris]